MRIRRRPLKQERQLSTGPLERLFWQWLEHLLRDEHWRALVRERLNQNEPAEIKF